MTAPRRPFRPCWAGPLLALALLALPPFLPSAARAGDLEASGVTRPQYNAQLSFAAPGSVYGIAVKPGQAVRQGDLLMHLDSRAEDSRIAQLKSEIASSIKVRTLDTRIKQAQLDMDRYGEALRHKAATVMEYQHAQLAFDLSRLALEEERFRIEQLRRGLSELEAQRDHLYLYAPCDGFVEDVAVEKGMAVDRNVPALRLVAIDPILVDLTLPVDEAMRLRIGDRVEVRQPGAETVLAGEVDQIAKIAILSNRTLKVRVHVPNPRKMPVGLMVTVRFPGIDAGARADAATTDTNQGEIYESGK
ncbi:efflux RND transporter periplasmic adaptor subunit [Pseudodesulfovibrio sp.]|uniref:efflux RND transporter periplasmic adaptor subunit n=1 Tax=Pseudodesulfovibrio sp. TaxID=2035812 RepID=UPI00262EE38D|nr:efflux RND transporter periplasmic adaptor subunit [Pseudodesulfovibrio sp.]MDD3311113.1 efflux RND transporter periplasmic adaptor subunit [Pseudodesulfovibrio sp.]